MKMFLIGKIDHNLAEKSFPPHATNPGAFHGAHCDSAFR